MQEERCSGLMPILALRGIAVFPDQTVHFDVGRPKSIKALDAAMKAADVKLQKLYAPPSETNFGGGLLTGSQSACQSACDAFLSAVTGIAAAPKGF